MKQFTLRLKEEHHAMLVKQAEALGLSLNAYLVMTIIKLEKGE